MMNGLIKENGKFRSQGVGIFDGESTIFVEFMLKIIKDSLLEMEIDQN